MSTWNKLSCHSLGEVYGGQYVHVEQAFISFPRWSLWKAICPRGISFHIIPYVKFKWEI